MNDSALPEGQHRAYICLGSNIRPAENLQKAVALLSERTRLLALSACWETQAVGSSGENGSGPNFLNVGACLTTPLDAARLKQEVLAPIEKALGRERTADKYAPRTIDLDITIFDGQALDMELWRRVYLALIFAELLPEFENPATGETLRAAAERLQKQNTAILRRDVVFV